MLRGGRVSKFKGVAASYSPELGLTPSDVWLSLAADGGPNSNALGKARRLLRWSVAPLALLATGAPAFAQAQDDCVEVIPDNFVCVDNGDPATVTQDLGEIGEDITVTIQDGFEVDTSGSGGDAINVDDSSDVTIAQESGASTITGRENAISVTGSDGSINITTGGDVAGLNGSGIEAQNNAGAGEVTINSSAGEVYGYYSGIIANNNGQGATTITTADVITGYGEAGTRDGIYVANGADSTDLTIDSSAGTVEGQINGIRTINLGTGSTSITTADVEGGRGSGIFAINGPTASGITVDSTAGAVTGDYNGIFIVNNGTGSISITTADVVSEDIDGSGNGSSSGISALSVSRSGDITIDSTAGDVVAQSFGIRVSHDGTGETFVRTANVSGGNFGILAVNGGYSPSGSLTIDTSAGSVMGGDRGISVSHYSIGNISITTADVLSMDGDGINVTDTREGVQGVDVTIDTAQGTVTGGRDGLYIENTGTGNLSITTANVEGEGRNGISATNLDAEAGSLTIDTSAGSVIGRQAGITAINNGSAGTLIRTADVTVLEAGEYGDGIYVSDTGAGDVVIDTTQGAVSGEQDGIDANNSAGGDLTITTANIFGNNGDGIDAENQAGTGDLTINTVAGAVSGSENGIFARNYGTGATTITTANVNGVSDSGIDAETFDDTSDLIVDTSAGSITADQTGVRASNNGSGILSITTADVTSENDTGIRASSAGGNIIVNTSVGAVEGNIDGIRLINNGSGSATITTSDISANGGSAISVNSGSSTLGLTIDTTAGALNSGGSAIVALNAGGGNVAVRTGDITTINEFASGVNVRQYGANDGEVLVDTTAGDLNTGFFGVFVGNNRAEAGANTVLTGDITAGNNAISVFFGGTGDHVIDSTRGALVGARYGIYANNIDGIGDLNITTADTTGESLDGIHALQGGANLTIDTSGGAVTGANRGIFANHTGSGNLTIVTADVEGASDTGIQAVSAAGAIGIDTSAGRVSGNTSGIFVDQQSGESLDVLVGIVSGAVGIDTQATSGDSAITLSSTGVVTGTDGFGIDARSTGGSIAIRGSSGAVSGASDAINVRSNTGDIAIANIDSVEGNGGDGLDLASSGGAISVRDIDAIVARNGNGILADAGGADIAIAGNGDIFGTGSGIAAQTQGTGVIDINLTANTSGDTNGVAVSTQGGAVALFNSGVLTGGDFAVFAGSDATGPITLENSGTIASAIRFASGNDNFVNAGTFTASGTSDFGEGNDTFTNEGVLAIAGAARFDRLETFELGGVLSLADQNTAGSFATSGDFVGVGGRIVLDVDFASNAFDQIIIGGTASGQTLIELNALNTDLVFDQPFTLVHAGAGTEATAFALAGGDQALTAFVDAQLGFDAANNSFFFELGFNNRVFEGAKIAENTQALWYRSNDAWADAREFARMNEGETTPAWVVAYGASTRRDETIADTGSITRDGPAVLDYAQDFFGLQAGVDFVVSEALSLGVTGGYLSSTAQQDESGNGVNFDALNIGVSASYTNGGFFADMLAKVDTISGDLIDPQGNGFSGNLDAVAFGVSAVAGYRIGSKTLYVEPHIGFEWQDTDIDDLQVENQSFAFDNVKGARGRAGVRLVGHWSAADTTKIGYYLDASAVKEFDGETDVRFSIGNGIAELRNLALGTYANVEAGVTVGNGGPVNGFFEVEGDLSGEFDGFAGRVGVSIRF